MVTWGINIEPFVIAPLWVCKSGNDLCRTQTGAGSGWFVGRMRSEWRDRSVVDTSDTPRKSERAATDRGLNRGNTAPTTNLKRE